MLSAASARALATAACNLTVAVHRGHTAVRGHPKAKAAAGAASWGSRRDRLSGPSPLWAMSSNAAVRSIVGCTEENQHDAPFSGMFRHGRCGLIAQEDLRLETLLSCLISLVQVLCLGISRRRN